MNPIVLASPESTSSLFKLGVVHPLTSDLQRYAHPHTWTRQGTSGPDRLLIAPAADPVGVLVALLSALPEPITILYVLLLSRQKENATGRYQSAPFARRADAAAFLMEYRHFLEEDGRHNVWILSAATGQPTLVYDQHDLIYAYGPLDDFTDILSTRNIRQADETVALPMPHIHLYHHEMDRVERDILTRNSWTLFPLVEGVDDK